VSAPVLPVLDLRQLDTAPEEFLQDLRDAARTHGFFYLGGHGLQEFWAEDLLQQARKFFARPLQEKLAIEMIRSPHFRGYTRAGGELTRGRADWREQVDFAAERPSAIAEPGLPAWARLEGPNLWPEQPSGLRPAVERWQAACQSVFLRLLRAFARALEQPEHVFDECFSVAPVQRLKIIHYPAAPKSFGDQGVGPHKDTSFLTLLLQDENRGLQVQCANGWVDADPKPGTLVINIGEALELASNGYFRANVHQVLSPPPGVDRYSVAYFPGPRLDARVPLLPLSAALAAQAWGPESDPQNPLFHEVGANVLKSRLRSHPDVAQRYYADVLAAQGIHPGQPASAY
jgi:isopenicillin N synthase-like dioxygenase